jgi:NAD-dependent deacetylase
MKITIITGAGISQESGIQTFRDAIDGLWNNHKIDEVASASGWKKDPEKVLGFYNDRRAQCRPIQPNDAHIAIAELEKDHEVTIITQNVDDLHEKAGSTNILHIHGELMKGRDSMDKLLHVEDEINIGDLDEFDEQIRPHVVFFGEYPWKWKETGEALKDCDILIVVGTSFTIHYIGPMVASVKHDCKVFYVDPQPDLEINSLGLDDLTVLREKATTGVRSIVKVILDE